MAVEVHITVENLGSRLLRLTRARIRLQQVEPSPINYDALAALQGKPYWSAVKPESKPGKIYPFFKEGELNWPMLEEYNDAIDHRIEPGEKDLVVVTFLLSCSVRVVRVAANIQNDGQSSKEPAMWKTRSFASLEQACGNKQGEGK